MGLCAHWAGGASTRATTNTAEATERTRSKHRAGIASEASGQCEVLAKYERTTELPPNAGMGAPRADANDGEKAGVKLAKMLNYTYKPFWRSEVAAANPKISFLSNVPLCGGGCGGSR